MAQSPSSWPLAVLAFAACTDAQYRAGADAETQAQAEAQADAGDGGAQRGVMPGADAQAARDAATLDSPWYAPLAEHYAISIRFYSKDRGLVDQARFAHEIIMLGRVSREGERVYLDAQRCRDHGNVLAVGLTDEFGWPHAPNLPSQRLELVNRPEGIRSEAPPRPIGFTPDAGCTVGEQQKVDGRAWLPNGMCTCSADALPMLASDCRVIDEDQDGQPGVTVQHSGVYAKTEPVRALDNCQISNATLSPDGRLSGFYIENYDYLALSCEGSPCSRTAIAACPLMLNPVLFEPLAATPSADAEWSCDEVLSQLNDGKLFPLSMLTFVPGC